MNKVQNSSNSVNTNAKFIKHMDSNFGDSQNHTRIFWYISEDDCRYPDQVRFLLRQEGLRCVMNPHPTGSDTDEAPRPSSDVTLYVILQTVTLILVSKFIGRF
jgi:hypothetical protein